MTQSATTSTEVGHDQHAKGPFPPFDSSTFGPQLISLAIVFGALYLLMSRIALPRVAGILEARRLAHETDLAEAERLKNETAAAISTFEKTLADAHAHAEEIGAQTRDRLTARIMEERKAFDEKIAASIASEEDRIALGKARAMENVREMAIDATRDIVSRFTGKSPPNAAIVAAVDKINHV
ncbi:MAG: F0F1 ATP synthase subunit B' [Hyphomicrobiales bacterium]